MLRWPSGGHQQGWKVAAAACFAVALLARPAAAGNDGPGAPTAGDPYFPTYGNGGYHVSHYDIRLRYQPTDDHLQGTTTIVARPTQNLTAFDLDFLLNVRSVRVDGKPAGFRREGGKVIVTPSETLPAGKLTTFVVDYDGVPSTVLVDGKSNWNRTKDGAVAVGEPEVAAWWYPSNDHPRDKATFDISVAVPDGTQVVSNGANTGRQSKAGWTSWDWRMSEPEATYLAFVAIGQYEINTGKGFDNQPIVTAYAKDLGPNGDAAKASVERTPEAIEFLSGLLGRYPYGQQGGVVPGANLEFALENQSRPTYSPAFFKGGADPYVVVHELAHQWFGDSVSVDTWRDIWLNEGFASYAEWYWSEKHNEGSAQQLFDYYYSSIPANDPFWQVLPGDPGQKNVFHKAVYTRGAMAVQALRNAVGDQTFSEILRQWVQQRRNGNGTIEQFITLAKQVSGKNLDGLFKTWLFTPGKPPAPAPSAPAPDTAPAPASAAKMEHVHAAEHAH